MEFVNEGVLAVGKGGDGIGVGFDEFDNVGGVVAVVDAEVTWANEFDGVRGGNDIAGGTGGVTWIKHLGAKAVLFKLPTF